MTRRRQSWRLDLGPLVLAATGLFVVVAVMAVIFITPTRFTESRPTGPRLEVTAVYPVPRPAVGEACFPVGASGVTNAGPVVCREVGVTQWRWVVSP